MPCTYMLCTIHLFSLDAFPFPSLLFVHGVGGEQQMRAYIATLTNNPEFLEELRKELDGKV